MSMRTTMLNMKIAAAREITNHPQKLEDQVKITDVAMFKNSTADPHMKNLIRVYGQQTFKVEEQAQ